MLSHLPDEIVCLWSGTILLLSSFIVVMNQGLIQIQHQGVGCVHKFGFQWRKERLLDWWELIVLLWRTLVLIVHTRSEVWLHG